MHTAKIGIPIPMYGISTTPLSTPEPRAPHFMFTRSVDVERILPAWHARISDIHVHLLHVDGKTIILVTHEPDVGARARRIIHMRDGSVE